MVRKELSMEPQDINDHDRQGDGVDSRKLAGFDYSAAIGDLNEYLSDERIAYYMGYGAGKGSSIYEVKGGATPRHDKGEMLWALYRIVFGKKPPHSALQAAGLQDDAFLESVRNNVKKGAAKP